MRVRELAVAVCLAAVLSDARPACAQRVELELADGTKVAGELAGYDAPSGNILLNVEGRIEAVPWARVRGVTRFSDAAEKASLPPSGPVASASAPAARPEALRHYSRGLTLLAGAGHADAEAEFRKAVELDPWFVAARFSLARLYLDTRRPDPAILVLKEIQRIDPLNLKAFELLERAYEAKGWIELSHRTAVERLRATYAAPEADYRIAHHWMEIGNTDLARTAWEAYRRADPGLREPFSGEGTKVKKGEEALARGDYAAALQALHGAMQENPFLRDEVMARIQKVRWTLLNHLVSHKQFREAFLFSLSVQESSGKDFAFLEALYRKFTADVLTTGQVEELAEEIRLAGKRLAPPDYQALLRAVLATLIESQSREEAKPGAVLALCAMLAELYRADPEVPAALRGQLHEFAMTQFERALRDGLWPEATDYAQLAQALAPAPAETELAVVRAIQKDFRLRLPRESGAALQGRVEAVKGRLSTTTGGAVQAGIAQVLEELAPAAGGPVASVLPFMRDAFLSQPKAPVAALARLAQVYVLQGDRCNGAADPEGAARAYGQAIALHPNLRDTLLPRILGLRRARFSRFMSEGKVTAAREELTEMLAVNPKDESLAVELGELKVKIEGDALQGEKDRAKRQVILRRLAADELPPSVRVKVDDLIAKEGLPPAEAAAAAGGYAPGESRYLPLRTGAWYRYQRGDGFLEEIAVQERGVNGGRAFFRLQKETRVTDPSQQDRPYNVLVESLTLFQDDQGVYAEEGSQRDVLLRFPLLPGQIWERQAPGFKLTRRCVGLNGQVVTPKGTFTHCLIVEQRNAWSYPDRPGGALEVVSLSYYAPNIGLVKVAFEKDENRDRNLLLVDFKIPFTVPIK